MDYWHFMIFNLIGILIIAVLIFLAIVVRVAVLWVVSKIFTPKSNLRNIAAIGTAENNIRLIMPEHEANVIFDSYQRTFDHQAYIDYLEMVHDKWVHGVHRNEILPYDGIVHR